MADVIQIQRGSAPWKPADDALLAKEYQYYEIPTAGVIEQHGVRYFFVCIAGADEGVNLWIYSLLTPSDEAVLDSAAPEEFFSAIELHGPSVMALAVEGPGIVATHTLPELNAEELKSAQETLFQELRSWAEQVRELRPVMVGA